MPAVVDVETAVITLARTVVPAGWTVDDHLDDGAYLTVVVSRIFSRADAYVPVDAPLLQIDVWGPDDDRATTMAVAGAIVAALDAHQWGPVGPVTISSVGQVLSTFRPDPITNQPRVALTVQVAGRIN